jgi:hypothetical protein
MGLLIGAEIMATRRWSAVRKEMTYTIAVIAVALAAFAGALGLLRESLRNPQ